MDKDLEEKIGAAVSYEALKCFWAGYVKEHNILPNRQRDNVIHRQAFMHISRNNMHLTTTMIGRVCDRDHATVLHACKKHEVNYRWDGLYRNIWDNLAVEIEDMLLLNGVVPKTIEVDSGVKGIHFKYLDVSRRLRIKIKELDEFRIKVDREIKNARSNKDYVNGLEQRNIRLNEEVKRLRNLL
jgi:hypothetical protein